MNAKCKKEHLPGTKRTNTKRDLAETPTPGDKGDGSSAVAASAAQNNSQVDFLGLLQAMKSEIMGAIDEKLKSHPTPVYQTTKMPPQFLNNYHQSAVTWRSLSTGAPCWISELQHHDLYQRSQHVWSAQHKRHDFPD